MGNDPPEQHPTQTEAYKRAEKIMKDYVRKTGERITARRESKDAQADKAASKQNGESSESEQ